MTRFCPDHNFILYTFLLLRWPPAPVHLPADYPFLPRPSCKHHAFHLPPAVPTLQVIAHRHTVVVRLLPRVADGLAALLADGAGVGWQRWEKCGLGRCCGGGGMQHRNGVLARVAFLPSILLLSFWVFYSAIAERSRTQRNAVVQNLYSARFDPGESAYISAW